MNTSATTTVDHCLSFINCHLQSPKPAPGQELPAIKCVTISRQSGCGAHVFGQDLACCLQARLPQSPRPWTLLDRNLVEAVLQDHHLPARLARFMPEDRASQLNDIIEDLFSLHPPAEELVRKTSETILHLAELGNVILVGRGANIITASLSGIIHVRLVGSVENRVGHMLRFDNINRKEALARIEREDTGRRRYIEKYFRKNIDDPLLYDLIINTDRITLPEAARTVTELALHRASRDKLRISEAA